jgi:UDP-glucuronate decarboxylase
MMELAQMVILLTNSKSRIERHPLPGDDPKQRRPDISKAQALLNWNPTIQLEEGLLRTISDIDSRL